MSLQHAGTEEGCSDVIQGEREHSVPQQCSKSDLCGWTSQDDAMHHQRGNTELNKSKMIFM